MIGSLPIECSIIMDNLVMHERGGCLFFLELKQLAKEITESNDKDGVALVLERLHS